MKSNRNGRTGPDVTGSAQKNPRPRASTDPDDLLNALVERDRVATERLFASLADEDERIARLLADIAREQGPDIDAMLAAEQIEMDRIFAELDRQDIGAELDAMIAREQAEMDRVLAKIDRADPDGEIVEMVDAETGQIDRVLIRSAAQTAMYDRAFAEIWDQDETATRTKGRQK